MTSLIKLSLKRVWGKDVHNTWDGANSLTVFYSNTQQIFECLVGAAIGLHSGIQSKDNGLDFHSRSLLYGVGRLVGTISTKWIGGVQSVMGSREGVLNSSQRRLQGSPSRAAMEVGIQREPPSVKASGWEAQGASNLTVVETRTWARKAELRLEGEARAVLWKGLVFPVKSRGLTA